MKTQIALFFALLIAAMGCEKTAIPDAKNLDPESLLSPFFGYTYTGDLPGNQNYLKSATVTKTIKFLETSGVMEFSLGDCAPNFNVELTGYGQSSLMGKYHVLNTFCSDGVNPTSPILGFLTAANGDEIHTMVTDAGYDENGELLYYVYTVLPDECTGRFENIVSGEMIIYGTLDFDNLTWTCWGEGTLVFQYN